MQVEFCFSHLTSIAAMMALTNESIHLAAAQLWSVSAGGPAPPPPPSFLPPPNATPPPSPGLKMLALGFFNEGKR